VKRKWGEGGAETADIPDQKKMTTFIMDNNNDNNKNKIPLHPQNHVRVNLHVFYLLGIDA